MPSATGRPTKTVQLYAAGSLKAALTEAALAVTRAHGIAIEPVFGPSGLLRERLETEAAPAGVFASADLDNPRRLARAGKAGPVVLLARNRLAALLRPGLSATPETLLDVMLDPGIRLGTSTPRSDPSGDYAWAVFHKAETLHRGSRARLEEKALTLVGGARSAEPPGDTSAYAWHLREGRADLFLTYRTNARAAVAELPGAAVVELPPALATGADYGLTVLASSDSAAATAAFFLLSPEGQRGLAAHGFEAPLLPLGNG
jgi:ABC-type molybdate transport system substrate-binding protein